MRGKNKSTVEHTEKDIIEYLKESNNHMVSYDFNSLLDK
jgi:hypothetical protein